MARKLKGREGINKARRDFKSDLDWKRDALAVEEPGMDLSGKERCHVCERGNVRIFE